MLPMKTNTQASALSPSAKQDLLDILLNQSTPYDRKVNMLVKLHYTPNAEQNFSNALALLRKVDAKVAGTFEGIISEFQAQMKKLDKTASGYAGKLHDLEQNIGAAKNAAIICADLIALFDPLTRQDYLKKLNLLAGAQYAEGKRTASLRYSVILVTNGLGQAVDSLLRSIASNKMISTKTNDYLVRNNANNSVDLANDRLAGPGGVIAEAAKREKAMLKDVSGNAFLGDSKKLAAAIQFYLFADGNSRLTKTMDYLQRTFNESAETRSIMTWLRDSGNEKYLVSFDATLKVETRREFAQNFVDYLTADKQEAAKALVLDSQKFSQANLIDASGFAVGPNWLYQTMSQIQGQIEGFKSGKGDLKGLIDRIEEGIKGDPEKLALVHQAFGLELTTGIPGAERHDLVAFKAYNMLFASLFARKSAIIENQIGTTWHFERFATGDFEKQLRPNLTREELGQLGENVSQTDFMSPQTKLNLSRIITPSIAYNVINPVVATQAAVYVVENTLNEAFAALDRAAATDKEVSTNLVKFGFTEKHAVRDTSADLDCNQAAAQAKAKLELLKQGKIAQILLPDQQFNANFISAEHKALISTTFDPISYSAERLKAQSRAWADSLLKQPGMNEAQILELNAPAGAAGAKLADLLYACSLHMLLSDEKQMTLKLPGGAKTITSNNDNPPANPFITLRTGALQLNMAGIDAFGTITPQVITSVLAAERQAIIDGMAPKPSGTVGEYTLNGRVQVVAETKPLPALSLGIYYALPGTQLTIRMGAVGNNKLADASPGDVAALGIVFKESIFVNMTPTAGGNDHKFLLTPEIRNEDGKNVLFLTAQLSGDVAGGRYDVKLDARGLEVVTGARGVINASWVDGKASPEVSGIPLSRVGAFLLNSSSAYPNTPLDLQTNVPGRPGQQNFFAEARLPAGLKQGRNEVDFATSLQIDLRTTAAGKAKAQIFVPDFSRATVVEEKKAAKKTLNFSPQLMSTTTTVATPLVTVVVPTTSSSTDLSALSDLTLTDGAFPSTTGTLIANGNGPGLESAMNNSTTQANMEGSGALKPGVSFQTFMSHLEGAHTPDAVLNVLNTDLNLLNTNMNMGPDQQTLLATSVTTKDVGRYVISGFVLGKVQGKIGIQKVDNLIVNTLTTMASGEISTTETKEKKTEYDPLLLLSYALKHNLDLQGLIAGGSRELTLVQSFDKTSVFVGWGTGDVVKGMYYGASRQVGRLYGAPVAVQLTGAAGGVGASLTVDNNQILTANSLGVKVDPIGVGAAVIAHFAMPRGARGTKIRRETPGDLAQLINPDAFKKRQDDLVSYYNGSTFGQNVPSAAGNNAVRGIYLAHLVLGDKTVRDATLGQMAGAVQAAGFAAGLHAASRTNGIGVTKDVTIQESSFVFAMLALENNAKFSAKLKAQNESVSAYLNAVSESPDTQPYLKEMIQFYRTAAAESKTPGKMAEAVTGLVSSDLTQDEQNSILGGSTRSVPYMGVFLALGNDAAKKFNAEVARIKQQEPQSSQTPAQLEIPAQTQGTTPGRDAPSVVKPGMTEPEREERPTQPPPVTPAARGEGANAGAYEGPSDWAASARLANSLGDGAVLGGLMKSMATGAEQTIVSQGAEFSLTQDLAVKAALIATYNPDASGRSASKHLSAALESTKISHGNLLEFYSRLAPLAAAGGLSRNSAIQPLAIEGEVSFDHSGFVNFMERENLQGEPMGALIRGVPAVFGRKNAKTILSRLKLLSRGER